MTQISVSDLLSEWPDRQAVYADANGESGDLDMVAVHRWFQRGAVPVKYWQALIEGATRRGLSVDAARLLASHGRRNSPCDAEDAA